MGSSHAEQCLPSSVPGTLTFRRSQAPTPLGEARPGAAAPLRTVGLRGVRVSTRVPAPHSVSRDQEQKAHLMPLLGRGFRRRSLSLSSAL